MNIQFESKFNKLSAVTLPEFSGTRVMMMPLILGDLSSIPESLNHYLPTFKELFSLMDAKHQGQVGYITIDEKHVKVGQSHRRQGLHVDGVFNNSCGGWGGGGWGSVVNGMITVASAKGCKAYNQSFDGEIGKDGECDKLASQLKEENSTVFEENVAYWVDGLCVHQSLELEQDTNRIFLRLSMPSSAPWFEGYTKNPKGVMPTGKILKQREFQKAPEVVLKQSIILQNNIKIQLIVQRIFAIIFLDLMPKGLKPYFVLERVGTK